MFLNYAVIKKMENWKKIADYDNYSVSDKGRVRNDDTGRILKQTANKKGYLRIDLCANGKQITKFVHRLIAIEFIENPYNKPEVDHVDNNKQNNSIENLRWATSSENNYNKDCSRNAKYICKNKGGFQVRVSINGKQIGKWVSNMDDAIRIRDELLLRRKLEMGI